MSRSRFSRPMPKECRPLRRSLDLAIDVIGGQRGQPVIMALGPAVFDSHVLSLDVSRFAQSFPEAGEIPNRRWPFGRHSAEEADHWHRLLCARNNANGQAVAAPPSRLISSRRLASPPQPKRPAGGGSRRRSRHASCGGSNTGAEARRARHETKISAYRLARKKRVPRLPWRTITTDGSFTLCRGAPRSGAIMRSPGDRCDSAPRRMSSGDTRQPRHGHR